MLDIFKEYPDTEYVVSQKDIDDWIENEFDSDSHSPMELLLAIWIRQPSGNLMFKKSGSCVFNTCNGYLCVYFGHFF